MNSATSGGVGILTLLVVIFFALKVTGNSSMGWLWVFSPWWLIVVIVPALFVVGLVLGFLRMLISHPK